MPRLATFLDLQCQGHTLGLYCATCDRWGEADLDKLIESGRGNGSLVDARIRCIDCGELVDKQLRPPVPAIGSARAYIQTTIS
jgi:hypothetical protein